jgi:hypothetical protein
VDDGAVAVRSDFRRSFLRRRLRRIPSKFELRRLRFDSIQKKNNYNKQ